MKSLTLPALLVALAAGTLPTAAASTTVKLTPSSISMSSALKACPGALGAVSFVLGHTRIAEQKGVHVAYSGSSVQTVTFKDATTGDTAKVESNAHASTVSGANVKAASNGSVACVFKD
jgi:hypothetical protein